MAAPNTKTQNTNLPQASSRNLICDKLGKFCSSLICEVETVLQAYNMILEGQTDEATLKKLSTICPLTTGELLGHTIGTLIGTFICIPEVGSEIGKVGMKNLAKWMSEKDHLEKIKKMKGLIDNFQTNKQQFRKNLVSTGVDIFQSYERQFLNVSTDLGPEKAMKLLGKDAANRLLNYYKDNTFISTSLVDSILQGRSSKVWGLPLERPGFEVKSSFNNRDETWKTHSLFEKVGVLRENNSSNNIELYVNINGKNKADKYGFRRLLKHENWDDIKDKYTTFNFPKGQRYYEYKYFLTSSNIEECKNNALKNINEEDSNLMEERIKATIKEVTQDVMEQINVLRKQNEDNRESRKVLEIVDEWFRKFATSLDVNVDIKEDVEKLDRKLDDNHEVMLQKLNKIEEAIEDRAKNMKRKSIWFDIKDPVHLFTGRNEELEDLHAMMQRGSERVTVISQMTSISGLGGIGKTELSRKYAQVNCTHYDNNVVWINAENKENLTDSFTRLARDELGITTKNIDGGEKDIKTIVADVYKYICEEKSLFIFDNVETSQDIHEFLPRSLPPTLKKPYILITSRNREWEKGIEVKDLNELKPEDAITLVRKGLEIEEGFEEEEIRKLVETLQYFPLALRQAIAYILDQQTMQEYNIEDYLKEYECQARDLLDDEAFKGIDNDYSRTTFTTWKISTDKIACDIKHGKIALQILETIAYLAPENINRNIFLSLAQNNERILKQAVRLLVRYSLLSGKPDQSVLSIHRLVQETMRLTLKEHGKAEERLCNVLVLIRENLQNDHLDHAMSAWNHANDYENLVNNFSVLLSKIIDKLRASARYEEAYSFGTKAVGGLVKVIGDDHFDSLTTEDSIAEVVYRQGKYSETLRRYEMMLMKKTELLGENHPSTLYTLVKKGVILNNIGGYHEALDICRDVIKRKGDCFDADRLAAMHECSRILDHLGRYREAIAGFREVLVWYSKNPDSNPYSILYTQHGLGRALSNQGEYDEALSVYKEVLEQRNKLFGYDNPDSLSTMNNIAVVLNKLGKYDEALELFTEVLEKRNKKIGENHPSTLYSLHGIAKVLKNKGLYQESSEYFQKVIKKRLEVLGANAPAYLCSRHEYAVLLSYQGKYQEALKRLQAIYKIRKDLLGEDHPCTLTTMHEVAEAMNKCGEEECALRMFQEVLEKRISALGEDHPYTLNTKNSIAVVMLKKGRKDEALGIFQYVYEKRKIKLGIDHPNTIKSKNYIQQIESEK